MPGSNVILSATLGKSFLVTVGETAELIPTSERALVQQWDSKPTQLMVHVEIPKEVVHSESHVEQAGCRPVTSRAFPIPFGYVKLMSRVV